MFPTEPIRRYINLSFAKKLDQIAKTYAQEVPKIRQTVSPNSGMYFQAVLDAGVRMQKSKVDAWIEIVRTACREASRPVDNEVRNYALGEIHHMCEAGKGHIAQALANEITRTGMKLPDNLLPLLTAQANTRVSAIESEIAREFKIEELKEGIKKSIDVAKPVEVKPPSPTPVVQEANQTTEKSKWTRDQKIALGVGIALIVIAVATVAVMVVIPEIRSRLKLDKTPDATQQITTPEQNQTKIGSGQESNDKNTSPESAKPSRSPSTLRPAINEQPGPLPSSQSQAPSNPSSPRGEVGLGENNVTSDNLASVAWNAKVDKHHYVAGDIETSILAFPKAPMTFPVTLRIFYSADILDKPQPTFESSTDRDVSISDWSTAKNGLTLTIRSGEVDENNPLRIKVYSTTQLSVTTVACLSCK